MQDEVVWKINLDTFRIVLKVRCDKNISEFCCREAFFAPTSTSCSALLTAFSKLLQQSLFNRISLSNPSADNTRPVSKGLGTEVLLLSPYLSILIPEDWWMTHFSRGTQCWERHWHYQDLGPEHCSSPTSQESSQSQNVSLGWLKQGNILYN